MKRLHIIIYITAILIAVPASGQQRSKRVRAPKVRTEKPLPNSPVVRVKAPQWIAPVMIGDYEESKVVELTREGTVFAWMPTMTTGDPRPRTYVYDLRIVELLPMQAPDYAIKHNPVYWETVGLVTTQCTLPQHIIANMNPETIYVAQISTRVASGTYIEIENNGRSALLTFRVTGAADTESNDNNNLDDKQ